ncbi:MAG TPA: riboflavin synthase [Streptosporangiaceae bacterium]|nr:riboflavin synthase [Streptosporangiaceae bacterium]
MFTGIVEELGKVAGLDRFADSARLTVHGPVVAEGVTSGSSIAVNGVCVTVTSVRDGQFTADVMGETLARSSLGALTAEGPVNLERPLRADGRLDGHIVQGHVDGTGVITESRPADNWHVLRISISPELLRYTAKKGSVAVDGVSLTVSDISPPGVAEADGWFEVSLIPETLARTTLGASKVGDIVNIEVDVIAKYVERLLGGSAR